MNLTNFLKQADEITARYTKSQLVSFIHDIGRVLPEECREDFLVRLKAAGEETKKVSNKNVVKDSEIDKTYLRIRDNLKRIDSQEVVINGVLNEEYDDWYDDSSEEFFYEDNSGISEMLTEACNFVHTSMDREKYREGFEIGNQLFAMKILCANEYGDEEFSIADMVYHELLHCNIEQIVLDTLYCAYHATSSEKRPEVLYDIIVNADKDEISLEAVMQHGDSELPDFQNFLTLWITYLGDKVGHHADRLILEAVGLLNDVAGAIGYAQKYINTHPGLYLDILDHNKSLDEKSKVSIGFKAMEIMPKKYIMRSKVALKTADYVIQANEKHSMLEKCYFVAYESDTSALNYLRALLNGYSTEKKREELKHVFTALSTGKSSSSYRLFERNYLCSEREENKPDSNMILILRFLDGQFADVLEKGLNKSEALGWSGTFMKQGIALYLLYLYEGQYKDKGIIEMARIVKNAIGFSTGEYHKGLFETSDIDEDSLFFDLFSKWKSMVCMESDVRKRAIMKITKLLEKRTEGIMNANHRNYYGECAAFIAALGEVQESLGDMGAKQRLMTSYKDKYTRRSAFRADMKAYGWKDIKNK